MLLQSFLLLMSIIALYFGAEFALDSAEKIGKKLGMSPLVIGLLIIGFGTSLPEFFVSQLACYRGHPEIALGNIIGSNVANIFLILGVALCLVKLPIAGRDLRHQFGLHLILTIILVGIVYYGVLDIATLMILGTFFAGYLYYTFMGMDKNGDDDDDEEGEDLSYLVLGKLLAGFSLLYIGGEILVSSGSAIGELMGISEYVISALFVAFGTSFPELVTALLACKKNKDVDLITGNIIGSNIFNIAFVMGGLGVYRVPIEGDFHLEMAVLLGVSLFFVTFTFLKTHLPRFLGVIFLGIYASLIFYWV